MSRDLVERQEIIDRLDRVIEKGLVNILSGEHPITAEVMKEVIMALPSEQPEERTETHSCDCISRQAVIDMIMGQPPEAHYPSWYAEKIKALPSAESEIIHCTECKHSHLTYDGKNKYCVHWPNNAFSPTEYLDGGFYCGFAKRREE